MGVYVCVGFYVWPGWAAYVGGGGVEGGVVLSGTSEGGGCVSVRVGVLLGRVMLVVGD